MKKRISVPLALPFIFCLFAACGKTEPAETQPKLSYNEAGHERVARRMEA